MRTKRYKMRGRQHSSVGMHWQGSAAASRHGVAGTSNPFTLLTLPVSLQIIAARFGSNRFAIAVASGRFNRT